MNWIRNQFIPKNKHPYMNLDMGLIDEYTVIIPKDQIGLWEESGWIAAPDYTNFHYKPALDQTVMLSKPINLTSQNINLFIGKTIVKFGTSYGSYGMGGPGFIGLEVKTDDYENSINNCVIIFAVWGSGEYTLIDNRPVSCNPRYYSEIHPWISFFGDKDIENWDDLTPILVGAIITNIGLSTNSCTIEIIQNNQLHRIELLKNDNRLPPMGNGEPRRDAFNTGGISDYIILKNKYARIWVD